MSDRADIFEKIGVMRQKGGVFNQIRILQVTKKTFTCKAYLIDKKSRNQQN